MTTASFYASGLKFSCKRCSSCCRYEPGFVFLSENDLKKLSAQLKMNKNSFTKTYCRWVADSNGKEVLSLKEKSNNDCILWDNGCLVYFARPVQCWTFPFWESIVSTAQTWSFAASGCPGMNNGTTYTGSMIGEYLKMRISEPIINR